MIFIRSSSRLLSQRSLRLDLLTLRSNFSSSALTSSSSSTPSSPSPPPRPIAFAFDIDGVLKQGSTITSGAVKALSYLHGQNKYGAQIPYVMLTNSGGISEKERASSLSTSFGWPIKPEQVIQAHTVFSSLSEALQDQPILLVGGPEYASGKARSTMFSYGFKNVYLVRDLLATDGSAWPYSQLDSTQLTRVRRDNKILKIQFKAILVFHDSRDWGRDIQFMLDILTGKDNVWRTQESRSILQHKEQIPVYFSHSDLVWGSRFPVPRLGLGAFKEACKAVYKATTGLDLQYKVFGKPTKITFDYADAKLKQQMDEQSVAETSPISTINDTVPASDAATNSSTGAAAQSAVYMIGDNPESDIRGGNDHGWHTCLVQTGVYKAEQGEPKYTPTMIVNDVEEAVRTSLEREWGPGATTVAATEVVLAAGSQSAETTESQEPPLPVTSTEGQ